MTHSMTAFARREALVGEPQAAGRLTLELRGVNHRYLELVLRLPDELRALEPALREGLAARLGRGKVELGLRYTPPEAAGGALAIDDELVKRLSHASREVEALLYNPAPISSLELLRWPGVMRPPSIAAEILQGAALALLEEALEEFIDSRGREGAKLREVIDRRLAAMTEVVAAVRERMPQVLAAQREKLRNRVAELKVELDEGRLEQELALLAQKADVDEEMDRLETHIAEVGRVLAQSGPVGRRLDFLMQELNREANTLGSKSIDTETTAASVELKVLIEQMREQIQNIE